METLFEYEALVANGESIKGVFKGSQADFEKMIAQKKLMLIDMKQKKEKLDTSKFSSDDFLAFIEELYYLTNSGMPIDQSLKMLTKTVKKEVQLNILKTTLNELKAGSQLSVALKKALEKRKSKSIHSLSVLYLQQKR